MRIEGRFLGEYVLGFERLTIQTASTFRTACDLVGTWSSDLNLRVGVNTIGTIFLDDGRISPADSRRECRLDRGGRYRVTVWGNSGYGRVRPASVHAEF